MKIIVITDAFDGIGAKGKRGPWLKRLAPARVEAMALAA